ncbi:MAG: acetyl-CoA carboxylase biotin carboxyl carrier protein [Planctomycetes bacterium]|nr:acetyl-CoA carboxylase biotin carboxyl carrier protein [Planctomycetota bacterium]
MDIEHIRNLVELMVDNDLSRVELREGETHILLRRGQTVVAAPPASSPSAALTLASATVPAALRPGEHSASAGPAATEGTHAAGGDESFVRSPMVGTFYGAPDPDSPAFVKVGDNIGPESVVCLIEAMKVFNEIKAETSGRVTKVLVKNAEAVEFDQPLFAIASS